MSNFFKKINNKTKVLNNIFKINPHKHWNFLLSLFLVLIIGLILFSFYLLYKIKNDQIFQVKTTKKEDQTLLKEDLLKNVTGVYDKKANNIIMIDGNPSPYSDPSL